MESINGHSAACCNVPPIISEGYEMKGKYETIGDLKTCKLKSQRACISPAKFLLADSPSDITGPASSTNAILVIYDIFGYFPQTIQGADILATSDKQHSYQVFMPDFFEGEPCNIAWYPPVTEDQQKNLYAWFSTRGPNIAVTRIPKLLEDIESVYGKKTWAALGVSCRNPYIVVCCRS
jgi:hypothetical protein